MLVTSAGERFGSLCHYDTKRCQQPTSEMPILEALAPLIMAALEAPSMMSHLQALGVAAGPMRL